MAGVSRFDCYPSDFLNGIIGLTADEIAVYTVVMMLLYDHGEPVAYIGREREVQVRAGVTRKRLDKAISRLSDLRKISIINGALTNRRTELELEKIGEKIAKNRENSEKGGISTKQLWEGKHNKINGYEGPIGQPNGQPTPGPNLLPSSFVQVSTVTKEDSQTEPLSVSRQPTAKKRPRKRIEYPPDYDRFWNGYPTDSNMSKSEAFTQWEKLDVDDRNAAERSLTGFRAYCASHSDYRPKHACGYLSKRRFEGHLETTAKISEMAKVFVARDSPQGEAWNEFLKRTTGKSAPVNSRGGWYFPAEYPDERYAK